MDIIKKAYDLIRKRDRLNEEKQAYVNVLNSRKEKKKRRERAEEELKGIQMELYQIDRQLRDLPQFYKMYSMYEMEECIENEERYKDTISRLEEMKEEIEMNRDWANLEYYLSKTKVEPENEKEVAEERIKIRPEMEQQAKRELTDMYGREFDDYLFKNAVEETDELLDGEVAVRAEEIKIDKDMDKRRM